MSDIKIKLKWILIIILVIITISQIDMIDGNKIIDDNDSKEDFSSDSYESDINTINLENIAVTGGTWTDYGIQMTTGEGFRSFLYTSSRIDDGRKITITFFWRSDAGDTTITGTLLITRHASDGSGDATVVVNEAHNIAIPTGFIDTTYIIVAGSVVADQVYEIRWQSTDADSIVISGVQAEYFIKRVLT